MLVAGDNADAAASLEMMLTLMGNDVRTAPDGQAASTGIPGPGYAGWTGWESRPTATTEPPLGWRSARGLEASDARVGA